MKLSQIVESQRGNIIAYVKEMENGLTHEVRETVQAYFAEMAHHWTEELVLEWQRANPVGTEWLIEFARVLKQPERKLDAINYELVLNWLRRKYNLMSAEELADAIRDATGEHLVEGTLKKRRERLGLTTKRPPGPAPKVG